MKKTVLFLTAVLSAAMVMTGCGQKSEENTEVKTSYVEDLSKYVTLGEYKGLEYDEEEVEVTEDEIQSELDYMAESYATQEQVKEGAAKDGDTVNIYFKGYKDGVAFQGGEGTTDLALGSGQFIDGFEAGVVGMKAGETKSLNLTFPDPYPNNPDLAGAPVVFDVTLNYICGELIIPEITDEFIEANTDYATVEEYREYLKEAIFNYKTEMAASTREDALWAMVMENCEIKELPQDKVDENTEEMLAYYEEYASYMGVSMEDLYAQLGATEEEFAAEAKVYAESMVERALVFYSIIEAEGLAITDEAYAAKAEEVAAEYGYPSVEELETAIGREALEEDMLWQLVLGVIVDNAVIK